MAEDTELRIIQSRDHPHYGEAGWMFEDTREPTTGQYYFKLSNCLHGVAGCYVLREDLAKASTEVLPVENQPNPTGLDPYKYNHVVVARLTEAFGKSYNVVEACQYAGISKDTYYVWLNAIPEFRGYMDEAKAKPTQIAKDIINEALQAKDVGTAKWLLERRDPEFRNKGELGVKPVKPDDTREKIKDFLDDDSDEHTQPAGNDAQGTEPGTTDEPQRADEVAPATTDIS